jgi:hypothetical protein
LLGVGTMLSRLLFVFLSVVFAPQLTFAQSPLEFGTIFPGRVAYPRITFPVFPGRDISPKVGVTLVDKESLTHIPQLKLRGSIYEVLEISKSKQEQIETLLGEFEHQKSTSEDEKRQLLGLLNSGQLSKLEQLHDRDLLSIRPDCMESKNRKGKSKQGFF